MKSIYALSVYLYCVLFSVNDVVSQLDGDACTLPTGEPGFCTSYRQCDSAQVWPQSGQSPALCNWQNSESQLVCCKRKPQPNNRQPDSNRLYDGFKQNDDKYVEIETIYDTRRYYQSESAREKHSLSVAPDQKYKQTNSHSTIYEPNYIQPTYANQKQSFEPVYVDQSNPTYINLGPSKPKSTTTPSSRQPSRFVNNPYDNVEPEVITKRTTTRRPIRNEEPIRRPILMEFDGPIQNEEYSTRRTTVRPYGSQTQKSPQFIQNHNNVESSTRRTTVRPHAQKSTVPIPRPSLLEVTLKPQPPRKPQPSSLLPTEKPSGSGHQRPNIDEYPPYPKPHNTQRYSTTKRPNPKLTISELKCREYVAEVSETVHGLPLTTNPDPVTKHVRKCIHDPQPLIVGGHNASLGEFPHMAAVGFFVQGAYAPTWRCGGTLISDNFVLTAAHCTITSLGPPGIVRLGDHNLFRGDDGAHPVEYIVKEVIRHPGYEPPARYHDIALLRLSRPVRFTSMIRPACLYAKPTITSSKAIATGWGSVRYGEETSDVLLKVVLSIVDNEKCNHLYRSETETEVLTQGIIDEQMCAGEMSGGKDTCQGDSGGPIEVTNSHNHCLHHVIGVTSFGKRCGQPNSAGVYTRVSSYLPWIESVVWPELVKEQKSSIERF